MVQQPLSPSTKELHVQLYYDYLSNSLQHPLQINEANLYPFCIEDGVRLPRNLRH